MTLPGSGDKHASEAFALVKATLKESEAQLRTAKEQFVARCARIGRMEADLDAARSGRDDAERLWQANVERVQALAEEVAKTARAHPGSSDMAASSTGGGPQMQHVVRALEELDAIEAGVQMELAHVGALERAISAVVTATGKLSSSEAIDPAELEQLRQALELKDQELQLALMDADQIRSEYEEREQTLRSELATTPAVSDEDTRRLTEELGHRQAEAILLYTIMANHRRSASKLHDELESHRARIGKLPAAEIGSFLEQITRDLEDFEK